jgi:AcrR family transcriptional regulator
VTAKKKTKLKNQLGVGRPLKKDGVTVREDLILAGAELLKTMPLEEISLRAVASQAGVSHVAVYHHFENKNALFAAIADFGFQKYFSSYQNELQKTNDDFIGRFRALGLNYIQFILGNQQFARIMFGGVGLNLKQFPQLASVSRRTYRQLREIIQMGQRLGYLKQGKAKEKTLASWAMIHGIAMLFLEGRIKTKNNQKEMEDLIQSVTEYAYLGMKANSP